MSELTIRLNRRQILRFRQRVGMLDTRHPSKPESVRAVAWAGLQDSVPRAALLSIHARVEGAHPGSWEDPGLIQVWGPRFSAYVIAEQDLAVFTLGRLPDDQAARERAYDIVNRLRGVLGDEKMQYRDAAAELGWDSNHLRYAAPTGSVLIRWEGAGKPLIWMVSPPEVDPLDARLELARRHLHIFGPSTPRVFAEWAGIKPLRAVRAFELLSDELARVSTPIGDRWILASDESEFRQEKAQDVPVRFLPSGDSYWLLRGDDRELMVPDPRSRSELWTPRVWPGAILSGGEIVGTWRRASHRLTISPWQRFTGAVRDRIEEEAGSLPLPDLDREIEVKWDIVAG